MRRCRRRRVNLNFLFCIARKGVRPSVIPIPACGGGGGCDQGVKMKRKCHADFRVREISFPTVADRRRVPRAARCHAKGEKTIQHKFNKTEGEGVVAVGSRL